LTIVLPEEVLITVIPVRPGATIIITITTIITTLLPETVGTQALPVDQVMIRVHPCATAGIVEAAILHPAIVAEEVHAEVVAYNIR
jgi:hypothetical protein